MDYISVSEASERWGVSLRQVQRLLAYGRIPNTKKYGRSWMIPEDAEKPIDPRREKKKMPGYSLSSDLACVIASTAIPMPIDNPDAILDTIGEERLRIQYEGELAYLRGDFARTMQCFQKTEGNDAARLRACPVAVAASISLGDYQAYTKIDAYLKGFVETEPSDVSIFAELGIATAAVSVYAPNMVPNWLKEGDFRSLLPQARPDALYLRAKYFQSINQHETSLAVAQTAIALSASECGITFSDVYLRVTCAVSCCYLGRTDEAKRWLLSALRMSLPHGFITPFAEIVTALGGLMEQCLKQEFPKYLDTVLGQWERTWKNWTTFHNQFTKDNITLMLSLREYHIALLVARHVPYAKIARQHGISVGRLKNIMLEIYGKLFISGRDELTRYVY